MKLANRLISEFVVFDIGERYIKALFIREKWNKSYEYIYGLIEESRGIENGHLVDFRQLSECLFRMIYQIEIEVGASISFVSIVFSFGNVSIKPFELSIKTNGVVQPLHLEKIFDKLNHDFDSLIGCIFDYYELDHLQYIQNPLDMCGNTLKYKGYVVASMSDFIRNMVIAFNRHKIEVEYISFSSCINQLQIKDDSYVAIDVGFYTSRILLQSSANQGKCLIVPIGFKALLNQLMKVSTLDMKKCEELISLNYSNNQLIITDTCIKFFNDLFGYFINIIQTCGVNLNPETKYYLLNGITTVPLITRFIELKHDRKFEVLSFYQNFSTSSNHNLFVNCVHMANYIVHHSD